MYYINEDKQVKNKKFGFVKKNGVLLVCVDHMNNVVYLF